MQASVWKMWGFLLLALGLVAIASGQAVAQSSDAKGAQVFLGIEAALSMVCDSYVNLGKINVHGRSEIGSTNCRIRTNNSNGYTLFWKAADPVMRNLLGGEITTYTPKHVNEPELWAVDDNKAEWGGHLGMTSTTVNEAIWGSADNYNAGKWLDVSAADYAIAERKDETSSEGDLQIIHFGVEVGSEKNQLPGRYQTVVVMTALSL